MKLLIILIVMFSFAATSKAQVQVYMKMRLTSVPPVLIYPVANAGPDQAITSPASSVTLTGSGTDADGIIISYNWAQTSGPSLATIATPNSSSTVISSLVPGTYKFTLTVTDSTNLTGSDEVQVIVNNAVNISPTVDAGANVSITLPHNDTTLVAVGTDVDGTISSYVWVQLPGGPNTATIGTAGSASTTVSNLVEGTYWFKVTVTDNLGATGFNTVRVIVNSAIPPANLPPIANAGPDIIINL